MEPRLRALAAGLRAQEITNVAAFTEESITRHLQELRNGYEERVRDKLPEDAVDDYIEHGIEEWRVGDVFARTLRFSLFVTMYSFLEADLHHLCLDLQLAANLTIGPSEIAGKGITRSQTYLKKIVGINFPDQDKTWSKISDYSGPELYCAFGRPCERWECRGKVEENCSDGSLRLVRWRNDSH